MKLMGLSWMEETQHIAALLQLVREILPIAGGGFHPDENLAGRSIELIQFLFPDVPACSGIGERDRFDDHTFVGPTHAARTGLASNVNPTDLLDGHFLLRGSR